MLGFRAYMLRYRVTGIVTPGPSEKSSALRDLKGKVHPKTGHSGLQGEYRYSSIISLTSALDGRGGPESQRHAPAILLPGKRNGTHCTGDLVTPRVGLDRCGKSRQPPGFDPRAFLSVTSRYTDWTIPALVGGYCKVYILYAVGD